MALFSTTTSTSTTTLSEDSTDKNSDNQSTTTKPLPPRKFTAYPFDYHEELTITIDSLTNMGWGIGRVTLDDNNNNNNEKGGEEDNSDNSDSDNDANNTSKEQQQQQQQWVIMVPHVLVGEVVKVRVFRNQKRYSEADLVQVLQASPDRVEPTCPLAGTCGGCQYQHMSITAQREWKQKHVQQVLEKQQIRGYEQFHVLPTMGTDHVFGYRSKLTPHYNPPRETTIMDENGGTTTKYELEAIGFHYSSNRNLLDVPHCPIATPAINDSYAKVRQRLFQQLEKGIVLNPFSDNPDEDDEHDDEDAKKKKKKKKKKRKRGSRRAGDIGALGGGATLLFRQADDDSNGNPVVVTDHNQYMTTTVQGIQFRYLAGNFFQNNNYVLPLMVEGVVEAATRPMVHDEDGPQKQPRYLIDCYCGSGLFALTASKHFELCVGIEVNEKAVDEAANNAKLNSISNCQFVAASAEAIFFAHVDQNIKSSSEEDENHDNDVVNDDDLDEKEKNVNGSLQVQSFPREETVVVLDPPRKGCSPQFLEQLYEYSPQRIVYMSCDAATQARDAKGIVETGGYDIVSIQPFDLFPQTKHIENLMVFEKKKA